MRFVVCLDSSDRTCIHTTLTRGTTVIAHVVNVVRIGTESSFSPSSTIIWVCVNALTPNSHSTSNSDSVDDSGDRGIFCCPTRSRLLRCSSTREATRITSNTMTCSRLCSQSSCYRTRTPCSETTPFGVNWCSSTRSCLLRWSRTWEPTRITLDTRTCSRLYSNSTCHRTRTPCSIFSPF